MLERCSGDVIENSLLWAFEFDPGIDLIYGV
jgi:hypothetical protein